jgi:hypothetical protein
VAKSQADLLLLMSCQSHLVRYLHSTPQLAMPLQLAIFYQHSRQVTMMEAIDFTVLLMLPQPRCCALFANQWWLQRISTATLMVASTKGLFGRS